LPPTTETVWSKYVEMLRLH